jgi:hypothetical protein
VELVIDRVVVDDPLVAEADDGGTPDGVHIKASALGWHAHHGLLNSAKFGRRPFRTTDSGLKSTLRADRGEEVEGDCTGAYTDSPRHPPISRCSRRVLVAW